MIDPVWQGVVDNLLASAIIAVVGQAWKKGRNLLGMREAVSEMVRKDPSLIGLLDQAVMAVAKEGSTAEPVVKDRVAKFLSTGDAASLVRKIFAVQIAEADGDEDALRHEFVAAYAAALGDKATNGGAEILLDSLKRACAQTVQSGVRAGLLTAHEAQSRVRHRVVMAELDAMKKLVRERRERTFDSETIEGFAQKYRQQVFTRHGYIVPPHFDTARKIPIDDLYVPPDFLVPSSNTEGKKEPVDLASFLASAHRAVLLGNPGGGKSTLSQKLSHDLSGAVGSSLFGGRTVTPVLVVLREFAAQKKETRCSILDYVRSACNSCYQVPPVDGAFEYLLLQGRMLFIFDGLDELTDTSGRREIAADVESFCNLYPSAPVIVTSREVGYEQAPLDEKMFETYRLAPFNRDQVSDYVKKWFGVDRELTPDQRGQKAEAFLRESSLVEDLRSNPLMLALMCNIYRGENYIPKNRPDVYEKCALMLFERWDKSRGILVPLPFEHHINPAMKFLAHWLLKSPKYQQGVSESALIRKATEYLHQWRFDDIVQAEAAAREFIEFCRGRAWVFSEVGTDKDGSGLYQFSHRTFLEYFAAAHIVRTNPSPKELSEYLRPRIALREWDVVAQLAFQLQNKNVEGAGDSLLLDLLSAAKEADEGEKWNLISFAARALSFIVPTPKVTREVTEAAISMCAAGGQWNRKHQDAPRAALDRPEELFSDILGICDENRALVAETLKKALPEMVRHPDTEVAIIGAQLAIGTPLPIYRQQYAADTVRFWRPVFEGMKRECLPILRELAKKHRWIAHELFWDEEFSIVEYWETFGIESIFQNVGCDIYPGTSWTAVSNALISCTVSTSTHEDKRKFFLEQAQLLGKHLIGKEWPCFRSGIAIDIAPFGYEPSQYADVDGINPEALLGLFLVLAVAIEAREMPGEVSDLLIQLEKTKNPLHKRFGRLLRRPIAPAEESIVTQTWSNKEHQRAVLSWVKAEASLIRKPEQQASVRPQGRQSA